MSVELYEEVQRVARKHHRCASCCSCIFPQEAYISISAKWDGEFGRVALCGTCKDLWSELEKEGIIDWCRDQDEVGFRDLLTILTEEDGFPDTERVKRYWENVNQRKQKQNK